jgi:hypothetical protein
VEQAVPHLQIGTLNMAEREEDSMFVIWGCWSVRRKLTQFFAVSDAQVQEEEQLENKIINEGW